MAERKSTMGGVIGGLGGVIPTKDIPAARRAYLDYAEKFSGPDNERLNFEEFARQWKKEKGQ